MPIPSKLTEITINIVDLEKCELCFADIVFAKASSRTNTYRITPERFMISASKRSVFHFSTNYVKGLLTIKPPTDKKHYWTVTSQYYLHGEKFGDAKTDELIRGDTITIHCDRV